jgi:hypothetical protein
MRSLLWWLLGAVAMCACGGVTMVAADAPPPDGAPISREPYEKACSKSPDSCPSPYACTTTTPRHAGVPVADVCLIPCSSDGQCPENCLCEGIGVSSDSAVPDNHCDCT